jgi:hypothetical protein
MKDPFVALSVMKGVLHHIANVLKVPFGAVTPLPRDRTLSPQLRAGTRPE